MRSADRCPHCGADMTGPPIPQEYIERGYYRPGSTHYQRTISIVVNDHHTCWECPDCGGRWNSKGALASLNEGGAE